MDENLSHCLTVSPDSYAVEAARQCYNQEDVTTITEAKIAENDNTMVTVVCISYGHEAFIAQALDSFLMQKTNFKFKVFVGEDHGPDGTADIIRAYAEKYPDVIVPFLREENMGAQRNLIDLCQRATSPYIAFCEGDDYWVDAYKLQKQFDYMESHPELRACTTQTEIVAPEDWHLRSWYQELPDGKLLIPDSIPGYKRAETFSPSYIINLNVAHTSTHFYRWNYDLPIPDWYYQGIIGDTPLLLLQLGLGDLGHIPEITSAYRINEGSVFFDKDRTANFLRTRLDYVRYLSGLREFAMEHIPGYPVVAVENRIKLESANYLNVLVQQQDTEKISAFFKDYPDAGTLSLNAYISFFHDQRAMTGVFGWDGYQMTARNRLFRQFIRPQVRLALKAKKCINIIKNLLAKFGQIPALFYYWTNTRVKKDQNLWVFSGFNKTNYMDNTKYLYEFVLEHHPEIQAVWITRDQELYDQLTEEGKPVMMMGTAQCRKLVARAAVAFTDHFRMSDYDAFSGMNDNLKIVQLWHGVGLKSIGDLKNTDVPGVKFSDDILPLETDSSLKKLLKKLRYWRYAFHRELFEKYFLLVCPGPERVAQIADPWHIPHENCFYSGHPRNILLHSAKEHTPGARVLYAPTYRWNAYSEKRLVKQIVDNAEAIESCMERLGGELKIRLHPHTWRNYSASLDTMADKYSRISIDQEKDIYTTLADYDMLISDYSSIAYDFVLLDRPIVFFNYDFEEFVRTECELNYDYESYSPGIKTTTWLETLAALETYAADPTRDSKWRSTVRDAFYDMDSNDENNSERIIQEVMRRLNDQH